MFTICSENIIAITKMCMHSLRYSDLRGSLFANEIVQSINTPSSQIYRIGRRREDRQQSKRIISIKVNAFLHIAAV